MQSRASAWDLLNGKSSLHLSKKKELVLSSGGKGAPGRVGLGFRV